MTTDSPKGIQLRRTKGWRLPEGAVVVARPSRWGNIYLVGEGEVSVTLTTIGPGAGFYDPTDCRHADLTLRDGITADEAVALYRRDLEESLKDPDPFYDELREALTALRGRDLACWCGLDDPCHRDPLLELANR